MIDLDWKESTDELDNRYWEATLPEIGDYFIRAVAYREQVRWMLDATSVRMTPAEWTEHELVYKDPETAMAVAKQLATRLKNGEEL